MVSVMKLEKAPEETYADIGGLDQQIQEIKVLHMFCCRASQCTCTAVGLVSVHVLMWG